MEIDNLSDAEFKTLIIRMLQQLIGYFNIKKTQAEMNVTWSKIKKNLQWTNSGNNGVKNQIKNIEHKEIKSIHSEEQEEKIFKKTRIGLANSGISSNVPTSES